MRVLVVDDSRVCRAIYRKELEKGGYETCEAKDGLEALELISQIEVDLVALDIEMPNMDGYEVCERLRSQEFVSRFVKNKEGLLPVIFVTSHATEEGRLKGLSKGADDYITKGFSPGTLLAAVNRILKPTNPLEGLQALITEPDDLLRRVVVNILKKQHVNIIEAVNGTQAIEVLSEMRDQIDMVIASSEIADMSGEQFCRKIRRELSLRKIPVVILTAEDDRRVLLDLFESGATDYLHKPFDSDELVARLKVAIKIISAATDEAKKKQHENQDWSPPASKPGMDDPVGMAEFATSILHNINNVLNSVFVSCNQLDEQIRGSKVHNLLLSIKLMEEHKDDLSHFLTETPKGKILPRYMFNITKLVEESQIKIANEIHEMTTKINLMKDVIHTQQTYAKGESGKEPINLAHIAEESLKIQYEAIRNQNIQVERRFEEVPLVVAPKAKLTHVLINLIKNAIEAMAGASPRILTLGVELNPEGAPRVTVSDTGMGISQENLEKLFTYGFTTKSFGHGFGLAYCAKSIKQMGAKLYAKSEGQGQGASFIIDFEPSANTDSKDWDT